MDIHYARASRQDFPEVWAMMEAIKKDQRTSGISLWDENYPSKEILMGDIERGEMYLGRVEGRLVCLYVLNDRCDPEYQEGQWPDPEAPYCVFHRFCVEPACQGQGIAHMALGHLEDQCRLLGAAYIHMDCCMANPVAYHLYTTSGYRQVGQVLLPWDKGMFSLLEKKL